MKNKHADSKILHRSTCYIKSIKSNINKEKMISIIEIIFLILIDFLKLITRCHKFASLNHLNLV